MEHILIIDRDTDSTELERDYLEINYDDMDEQEIALWYEAVTGEEIEEGEKEEMHRLLLDTVYELEESDIGQLVRLLKKAKGRFAKVYGW